VRAGITTAVIPAAGIGSRARDFFPDKPKGFIPIDGATLIERSVGLLESRGVTRIVLVVGFRADCYREFAASRSSIEIVENHQYANSGSMASVACGIDRVDHDLLLLESDLYYEPRALDELFADERADVVLASGATDAGDEYWVEAPDGSLKGLSPHVESLASVDGEFVGITKVSAELAQRMLKRYTSASSAEQISMRYEADALLGAALEHDVGVRVVDDLLWGEVDCLEQFHGLQSRIEAARGRGVQL